MMPASPCTSSPSTSVLFMPIAVASMPPGMWVSP